MNPERERQLLAKYAFERAEKNLVSEGLPRDKEFLRLVAQSAYTGDLRYGELARERLAELRGKGTES